jgi:dihydroceramidase
MRIVLYAIHGIRKNSGRKDAFLRNLPYIGIMGVGVGSFIFHATLKNYTQWCTYPFPCESFGLLIIVR